MQSTSIFELFSDIDKFVSEKKVKSVLHSLIGSRILDYIHYLPIKNLEILFCTKWSQLKPGNSIVIRTTIKKHYNSYRIRGAPYKISVLFDNKIIYLIFFSKYTLYLKKIFPENENVFISGKLDIYKNKFQITHPSILEEGLNFSKKKNIKVFYRQKKGIKSESIEKIIHDILIKIPNFDEWNENIFHHYKNIPSWKDAITNIHKPNEIDETKYNSKSYIRLAYDELLATQISLGIIRNRIEDKLSNNYTNIAISKLMQITKKLYFDLTKDQEKALIEIIHDLKEKKRMMRLLHGDVGSGKTIVAFLSALFVINSGYQVAIMVPTEILAKQHFKVAQKLFDNSTFKLELLIASSKNKKEIYKNISNGSTHLIIGTQALIQEKLEFHNLSYVIIDEQHRFGVNQRLNFRDKGKNVDMLLLSATPIPRTMLLAALGDINLTTIKKKPFENKINTIIKSEDNIDEVILYLNTFLQDNKKVFWVCPMISDEDNSKSSITSRFKILNKKFKKVDILHGKLSELQKQTVLNDFKSGKINLLVCTVVIEVGIDIPDANIILIDQAEMFGMAQIHQLRGRVGRGSEDGICILLYKNTLKEYAYQRLLAVKETYDGFDIAEKDLNLRGGGDIQGKKQYGYQNFIFFNIYVHKALIDIAVLEAYDILKKDPYLKNERGKRIINLLYIFEKNKAVDLISAG